MRFLALVSITLARAKKSIDGLLEYSETRIEQLYHQSDWSPLFVGFWLVSGNPVLTTALPLEAKIEVKQLVKAIYCCHKNPPPSLKRLEHCFVLAFPLR